MKKNEFMYPHYDSIQEPLNLVKKGQEWFAKEYNIFSQHKSEAVVLGATPWLAKLCSSNHNRVNMVDMSENMLEKTRCYSDENGISDKIKLHNQNWLDTSYLQGKVETVCADNSFAFLPLDTWDDVLKTISEEMEPEGTFISRFMTIPEHHRNLNYEEICNYYKGSDIGCYTEIRCQLMYSHSDRKKSTLDVQSAVDTFLNNQSSFKDINNSLTLNNTDLANIVKYKDGGINLTTPSLNEIINYVSRYFDIVRITYGPYGMTEYFPLIICRKKNEN